MEEVGLAWAEDRAAAEVGVEEGATDEIRAICGGIGWGWRLWGRVAGRRAWGASSKVNSGSGKRSIWFEVRVSAKTGVKMKWHR